MRSFLSVVPLLAIALLLPLALIGWRRHINHADLQTIAVGGQERSYLLHVPSGFSGKALPLVLVFHGGGSNAQQMVRFVKFDALADKEGFIAAYPNAIGRNWNDGRNDRRIRSQRQGVDDIAFVSALIEKLSQQYRIDSKRIYATGISNGAIFSYYLASRMSDRIAAIAPVAGDLAKDYAPNFAPVASVSVFAINGTADPLVPYRGGGVAGVRGAVLSATESTGLWVKHDACQAPSTGNLPDSDPSDDCTVSWQRWSHGQGNTEVLFYTINGGGHTWPGGAQYLPKRMIGPVCRDFDATTAIWDFFKEHPKQ